jgi:hypothetical protein
MNDDKATEMYQVFVKQLKAGLKNNEKVIGM